MPLTYTIARIYTSEASRHHGRPLYQEVVELVARQKISARCQVVKGIAGCYESGEMATFGVEVLSYNMPLEITVIMPRAEAPRLLPQLEAMVPEGLMTVEERDVHWHKGRGQMIPRQLRVRDVMTPAPCTLQADALASEALRLLLSATFHGVPIVDAQGRPVGMVTHGDLLRHTALPVKVGLFSEFGPTHQEAMEKVLKGIRVADLMSRPAVAVQDDLPLAKAVDLMLEKDLKRLPAVGEDGAITGVLSRLDVFKTIMDQSPGFDRGVALSGGRLARDAMRADTPVLPPTAPVWEALPLIDATPIHRVAVVDGDGKLLGLVSDKVLMAAFSDHKAGLMALIVDKLAFTREAHRHAELHKALRASTIGEVMRTDLYTVTEESPVDEALALMVERRLKRVPVVDGQGRFKGMLTRDSLLRAMNPPV